MLRADRSSERSSDHTDRNAEVELGPVPIGRDGDHIETGSERDAGPISERQPGPRRAPPQLRRRPRLHDVERVDLDPRPRRSYSRPSVSTWCWIDVWSTSARFTADIALPSSRASTSSAPGSSARSARTADASRTTRSIEGGDAVISILAEHPVDAHGSARPRDVPCPGGARTVREHASAAPRGLEDQAVSVGSQGERRALAESSRRIRAGITIRPCGPTLTTCSGYAIR